MAETAARSTNQCDTDTHPSRVDANLWGLRNSDIQKGVIEPSYNNEG